jgi:hypothetical protein
MSVRLLVILPVFPWPARRDGMAVRFLPILQYLGRRHLVDLIVIDDAVDSDAATHIPELASVSFLQSGERRLPVLLRKLITAARGIAPVGAPMGEIGLS